MSTSQEPQDNINNNRYEYVEIHYDIIDVNAEKEVLAINFLERKRELSDFINGNYYRELYNVINKTNIVASKFCEHKISRSISCVFLLFHLVPKLKTI